MTSVRSRLRLYILTLYYLCGVAPWEAVKWLVRGPQHRSWTLRTTVIAQLMQRFTALEGVGWQAPFPRPARFSTLASFQTLEQGPPDLGSPPKSIPSLSLPPRTQVLWSTPRIDTKGFRTIRVLIPWMPFITALKNPIHPYSHTYLDPKDGCLKTVRVEPEDVKAFWIEPPSIEGHPGDGKGKVLLVFHGGGYAGGSPLFPAFYKLARKSQRRILSVHYRLGRKPQSRFPAPIQDGVVAYLYLLTTCGYPASSVTLMGDSAGGGLASALLYYLARARLPSPIPMPGHTVLLSPWVDLTASHDSHLQAPSDYLQPLNFRWASERYTRHDKQLLLHPLVSPERADWKMAGYSLRQRGSKWPATLIVWGELETLRDEDSSLGKQFREAGFEDLTLLPWRDMIHDFGILPIPEARDLRTAITGWLIEGWRDAHLQRFSSDLWPKVKL